MKNKKTNKTKESNYIPASNSKKIQRMLNNLKNDTSLGLTKEKKTAMLMAAERLLNDNYKLAFVAGVLGNIQNEGNVGQFESSNYKSNQVWNHPILSIWTHIVIIGADFQENLFEM